MDIDAVFEGLASAVSVIEGLLPHAFVPDSVVVPAFFPVDVEVDFDQAMSRGADDSMITGQLLVSRASDRAGQKSLKDYMAGSGPKSLKAAIEADETLGGTCHVAHLKRFYGYGQYKHAGLDYLGIRCDIGIMGGGT